MDSMTEDRLMAMMRDQLAARDAFVATLLEQARALPRVAAAGASYALPLGQEGFSRTMTPEGGETAGQESPAIAGNVVDGDYFAAMGMRVVAGRAFTAADRFDAPPVMMVNETLAATFWPAADPVGKRIRLGGPDNPWVTVIGVVADVHGDALDAEPQPRYYRSLSQVGWPDALFVVVRSGVDAESIAAGLRRIVTRLDPQLPLTDVTTTTGLIDSDLAAPRFRTMVLTVFGTLATVLALIGAYGVASFVVADRRRELGVRMAIGASGRDLVRMVLARELRPVLAGVLLGLAGTVAAARLLAGLLYGVTPFDPLTYATVATLMVVVMAAACYLPARRAASVAPNEVLRAE
jgi:predicted permease